MEDTSYGQLIIFVLEEAKGLVPKRCRMTIGWMIPLPQGYLAVGNEATDDIRNLRKKNSTIRGLMLPAKRISVYGVHQYGWQNLVSLLKGQIPSLFIISDIFNDPNDAESLCGYLL